METKPPEKKGLLTKLKENVDDHEEQMAVLGADGASWCRYLVRVYYYLNYVELPMVKKSYGRGYHVPSFDFYGSTSHVWLVHWQW